MHSKEWNELFKHCEILVYDSGFVLVSVLLGCDAALLDDGCSTFEDMNIDMKSQHCFETLDTNNPLTRRLIRLKYLRQGFNDVVKRMVTLVSDSYHCLEFRSLISVDSRLKAADFVGSATKASQSRACGYSRGIVTF
jgi:hypothetical protein